MEYRNMLWENDQRADRLISTIHRIGILTLLVSLFLQWKGIIDINDNRFYGVEAICIALFLISTVIVNILHIRKYWVRYVLIFCTGFVTCILTSYFEEMTFLLIVMPLVLSALYFDEKLGIFSIVVSLSGLFISQFIRLFDKYQKLDWYILIADDDKFWYFVASMLLVFVICLVGLNLSKRSTKLMKDIFHSSDELKRNRDGLDIIVDNTDILFRARSYTDIISIMLFLVKNLLEAVEGASCNVKGYVAIKERENSFFAINEHVEPFHFKVDNNKLIVELEDGICQMPLWEKKETPAVILNKSRLIMSFYIRGKLFAFVALKIHLEQMSEVLTKLVHVLYRNIHLAINNIKLNNDMYETQEEIVRAFSEISESKSGQTGKHIKRVSEYMKIMAEALELEETEKDSLVIASMMHDIGKLLIPESIIEKPGKLTESEFNIIKTHVTLGYKLLEYSPGRIMEIARVIALQHHEKWDGTGYLGMKGEEIDFYSRIMAIVDVFDALMSKRSYKERWPMEKAYQEIISQSGKHFDPQVVELFKAHFDEFIEVLKKYPDD